MKMTRLYTGSDAVSHFDDIEMNLKDMGDVLPDSGERQAIARHTETIGATGVFFREVVGRDDGGWHNAPRRQIIITLWGEWEIEISDGTRRHFGPGDIILAEDTVGKLLPHMPAGSTQKKARVVIGTVSGDIHDLGKNLVGTMLSVSGYEVFDLGKDVPIQRFVDEVKDKDAQFVGMSALMTTTMVNQKGVIAKHNPFVARLTISETASLPPARRVQTVAAAIVHGTLPAIIKPTAKSGMLCSARGARTISKRSPPMA